MDEKMKYWDAMRQPPPSALKPISAGRLKGKTDISPQWRYQILTEQFGPIGDGWKYEIVRLWLEPGANDTVVAFATVNLYYRIGEEWSDAIPGIGGAMFTAKETNGLHTSDEAFKMAVTDALSVAAKLLGVAADIYLGMWDGSKYKDQPKVSIRTPAEDTTIPADNQELNKKRVREYIMALASDDRDVAKKIFESACRGCQVPVVDNIDKLSTQQFSVLFKTLEPKIIEFEKAIE